MLHISLPFPNKRSHTDTSPAVLSLWTVTICPQSGNTSFAQVNVSNYPCAAGRATAPNNPHNVFSFPYPPVPGTPTQGGRRDTGPAEGASSLGRTAAASPRWDVHQLTVSRALTGAL